MNNLIEPTTKYINKIENSWHYLNCPKHMLNHDLDCQFRQAMGYDDKQMAVKFITDYLKSYNVPNSLNTAIRFVTWRMSIKLKEFNDININPYVDETPKHIEAKHKHICEWTEANTTYYHGMFGGGVNTVPTYNFNN